MAVSDKICTIAAGKSCPGPSGGFREHEDKGNRFLKTRTPARTTRFVFGPGLNPGIVPNQKGNDFAVKNASAGKKESA